MGETKRNFASLEEVKEAEAKIVGGEMEEEWYVGSDKYSLEEYNKAGVTWEHNFWSKDRYFIKGIPISQDMAEMITDKSILVGRLLTDDELRILGVPV